MAKVTITMEDAAAGNIAIEVRSEPPLPIATVTDPRHRAELGGGDQDLDIDRATPAQVAARLAVGEVAGSVRTAQLMVEEG